MFGLFNKKNSAVTKTEALGHMNETAFIIGEEFDGSRITKFLLNFITSFENEKAKHTPLVLEDKRLNVYSNNNFLYFYKNNQFQTGFYNFKSDSKAKLKIQEIQIWNNSSETESFIVTTGQAGNPILLFCNDYYQNKLKYIKSIEDQTEIEVNIGAFGYKIEKITFPPEMQMSGNFAGYMYLPNTKSNLYQITGTVKNITKGIKFCDETLNIYQVEMYRYHDQQEQDHGQTIDIYINQTLVAEELNINDKVTIPCWVYGYTN
jgi:hypothetical protein